jgi:hypothetical protein
LRRIKGVNGLPEQGLSVEIDNEGAVIAVDKPIVWAVPHRADAVDNRVRAEHTVDAFTTAMICAEVFEGRIENRPWVNQIGRSSETEELGARVV